MAFPPGFLDELRARVSLADLVGRRVRLMRRGREHSRAVPVSQREDAVLLRRRGQGVFSLLRLRRAWRRDRFCHARRQSRFYRGGRAAGRRGRDRGAAADPAGARAGAAPEDAARSAGRRGRVLRSAALGAGRGAGARVSDPARSRRGDDPAVPAGLGAGGPAGAAAGARRANSRRRCCARPGCCACRTMAAARTIISAAG